MRYLGVDWGEKRIGLALGDSELKLATPFLVASSIDEVIKIIKEEGIDALVIGNPKEMDGGESRLQKEFEDFLNNLKATGLETILIDERLSSKQADSLLGGKKDKAPRDAVAAMLILQSYFDKTDRTNKS